MSPDRKWLITGTVPANKNYGTVRVPSNKNSAPAPGLPVRSIFP